MNLCINSGCPNPAQANWYTCPGCTPNKKRFSPQEKFVVAGALVLVSLFLFLLLAIFRWIFSFGIGYGLAAVGSFVFVEIALMARSIRKTPYI